MTVYGPYDATVVKIHDGDTIDVDIVLEPDHRHRKIGDRDRGFNVHIVDRVGVKLESQSVRLYGCNAPELATIDGRQALAYLQTLVKVGDPVTVLSYSWDKYGGRIDGQVTLANGVDLTDAMIAAGHAKPWDGTGVKPT